MSHGATAAHRDTFPTTTSQTHKHIRLVKDGTHMNTTTQATMTVPASVTTQIGDLVDDLTGFHPALDRAVQALADLAMADLNTERSSAVVAALGGLCDGSLATLVGLVLRHIANPDTNPALAYLPAGRQQTLRRLGAEYAAEADNSHQQALASKAAGVIEGR